MNDEKRSVFTDGRDRGEIPAHIELRVGEARDNQAGPAEAERIAVGCRACDKFAADETSATGTILHDDRLSEPLTHLLRDIASERVVAAAWCERNHEPDRLLRIRLCVRCVARDERQCEREPCGKQPRGLLGLRFVRAHYEKSIA